MTTQTTPFPRTILEDRDNDQTAHLLQESLADMVDMSLLLKQAHWNVVGKNFRSVHLQLDEVLESTRSASDELAERMAALGVSPDGRAGTVNEQSSLRDYPTGFQSVDDTISLVADALKSTIDRLRHAIEQLGSLDPITEDLCIGISGELEKHLWMVQSQEV